MNKDNDNIRLAGIIRESIVDGPGIRFVVFAQGCPHNCIGCHNAETHDFYGGYDESIERIMKAIDEDPLISGVTFSGGEPVCQPEAFAQLAKEVKKRNLSLMMFSGYIFEDILTMSSENQALKELVENLDLLMDGPYVEEERDLTLRFRGSRNQRFIDVKKSLETGETVIIE